MLYRKLHKATLGSDCFRLKPLVQQTCLSIPDGLQGKLAGNAVMGSCLTFVV